MNEIINTTRVYVDGTAGGLASVLVIFGSITFMVYQMMSAIKSMLHYFEVRFFVSNGYSQRTNPIRTSQYHFENSITWVKV